MNKTTHPIWHRWNQLCEAAEAANEQKRLNDATQTSYLALNEARRLLGQSWQNPVMACSSVSAVICSAIACAQSHQVRYQKRAAEQVLIEHVEQLVQLLRGQTLPRVLKLQAARGATVLMGHFQREIEPNAQNQSQLSLAREAICEFWRTPGINV